VAPDTATPLALRRRGVSVSFRWWWLLIALGTVLFLSVAPRVLASPPHVSRVSFVNKTGYAIDVDVTGAQRDGMTLLGTAQQKGPTVVYEVIDQGDTWIFHFVSQGQDGGELRLSRADLARSAWQVAIPQSVGEQLAREGAPTSPALPGT
jgi:hypothetical protein